MPDLSSLGTGSRGVWTRRQALRLGLTAGQVDELVRTGTWQVLWRGVYTDGGSVPTPAQRAQAVVLATIPERGSPRSVAAGRTAARVHGLPLIDDDDPATGRHEHLVDDVLVDRSLPQQAFGGRTLLPVASRVRPSDVQTQDGLRVTSCARTLLDCARRLSHAALVCALDHALHSHLVTAEQVAQAASGGTAGGPALRAALRDADLRAEAPTETLARLLLRPVLPGLVPQVLLRDGIGRPVARFDLGDVVVRLAVEADGKLRHAGPVMVAKDRRRDRTAERLGWVTERVTWWELRREPELVVARIVTRHAELTARVA